MNSTNGTYINGELIKKHAKQHGDFISVGHHQLHSVDSQDGDVEQGEFTALPKAKLQVSSGAFAGRELELTKALTTLGRPGVQVAAIIRRSEGYFIVHVDSGKEDDFPQ